MDQQMFAIEKNVPIPKRFSLGAAATMRSLEVGDSFAIPLMGRKVVGLRAMAYATAARIGIKVTTREEADCVRVWRTA